MFLLDDLVMSPVRGFMMIVKEIHKAALAEREAYAQELTQRLSSLYASLDAGEITEARFDEEETRILDLLDEVQSSIDSENDYADDDEDGESETDDDEENQKDGHMTVQMLELPGEAPFDPNAL